jgi:aldose 1-epimerase
MKGGRTRSTNRVRPGNGYRFVGAIAFRGAVCVNGQVPLMQPILSRRDALMGLGVLATGWTLRGAAVTLRPLPDGAFKATAGSSTSPMTLDKSPFGKLPDGREADLFTLSNGRGVTLKFTNYGLIATELWVPDRSGKTGNVVLGFDNLPRYLQGHPFFGAIVGRVANRIAKGTFTLGAKTYQLAINNGPNHLHGGKVGFDKRLWKVEGYALTPDQASVQFSYLSSDGEEGYPGNLKVLVTYTLNRQNEWVIDYRATTDQPTPVNLTNHSYFNLAGQGVIDPQVLQLWASRYTVTDEGLIPTGEIAPVKGTPLDFTQPRPFASGIRQTGLQPPGYDHNFVLDSGGRRKALAARVSDPASGRFLEVETDQPGVQLYTANHFPADGYECNGGVKFPPNGAFCLETQNFPDAVNKPSFPKAVLRPGETYETTTIYRVGAQ